LASNNKLLNSFSFFFPSVILPLPDNVKEYLLDDGTLVVSGREDPPIHAQEGSDDAEEIQVSAPEFPEFTAKVEEAISSLGGSVFPKLNWSAPRDAYWIAMNSSLKCKLVLRKWCELIPGAEFRCFVKENKLIGISQRDYTQYYDHISTKFFKKHIQYKFLDEDCKYLNTSIMGTWIWLIDFNPFGEVTDSLLFTWDELTSGRNLKGDQSEEEATEQDYPVFRCTNSQVTVQPSPYLSYRLPKDFVDLSTGEDVHKLIDFLKLVRSTEKNSHLSSL
uniref:Translation initiation factor eIF2 assembly protein n=1 Tax=Anas platyrhynchos TaxID=8839 RepID=A0A8B9QUH1_ANAPL